jgi:hypothetical protein
MSQARIYHTQQVHYIVKRITFADYGKTVVVGVLPPNSLIISGDVIVTTAFNAGSTNTLNIGTLDDDDGIATSLALGTIGRIPADEFATSDDLFSTSQVTITAKPAQTGTAATAGVGYVHIEYIPIDNG